MTPPLTIADLREAHCRLPRPAARFTRAQRRAQWRTAVTEQRAVAEGRAAYRARLAAVAAETAAWPEAWLLAEARALEGAPHATPRGDARAEDCRTVLRLRALDRADERTAA